MHFFFWKFQLVLSMKATGIVTCHMKKSKYIRGKEVTLNSPIDAIANGIGMVHQHFKLVPSLTVYENILLGAEITQNKNGMKTPFIDQKEEIKRVEKLIQENHFELNATDKIEDISVGGRQRVEILKMLYRNVDILILDEPTAVLTPQEVDELMVTLKNLKEQGKTIIVITHKLREVMELADSTTVIKHGKVVGNVLKKDTSERELMETYQVSRITVRKAIDELVTEGYLYKIQGKGTYVKTDEGSNNLFSITSCTDDVLRLRMKPSRDDCYDQCKEQ